MLKGRTPTKAEKEWMSKVADLGCIVCREKLSVYSPAAIHHIDGKTKKDAHFNVLPLCPAHHQTGGYGLAIHCGRVEWEIRHGTQTELLEKVKELIGDQ